MNTIVPSAPKPYMTPRNAHHKLLPAAFCAALLSGCGMMGPYRGPEPFGKGKYRPNPPSVKLSRPVRVVVLVFQDKRPRHRHNLDWTRQVSNYRNTLGAPKEVRSEFHRAILAGLSSHPRIQMVDPDEFLRTQKADLVINGTVTRCEAVRKKSSGYFKGYSAIRVSLRNAEGKSIWDPPLLFTGHGKAFPEHLSDPPASAIYDYRPGAVAKAVEQSIEEAVSNFLASPDFARALRNPEE